MAEPAPTPATPLTERPIRWHAPVAIVVFLVGFLAYRVYSPRFATEPTREGTPPVARVDVNRAAREELLQVPGLGPSLTDAILSHRAKVGPFERIDDLQSVHGVGAKTLDKLKPWLTAEPLPYREGDQVVQLSRKVPVVPVPNGAGKVKPGERIRVNTADEAMLQRLPGIGPVMAGKIVAARDAKRFESVDDLRRVKGIGAKTLENIRPFVSVE